MCRETIASTIPIAIANIKEKDCVQGIIIENIGSLLQILKSQLEAYQPAGKLFQSWTELIRKKLLHSGKLTREKICRSIGKSSSRRNFHGTRY